MRQIPIGSRNILVKKSLNYFEGNFVPFFGTVEEVIDESYVRVRIFGIHPLNKEDVPTELLPPALVLYPTTGGQAGGGSISHNIEVDSWVMGYFVDYPYCMQPIVTNTIHGAAYSMSSQTSGGAYFTGDGSNYTGDESGGSENYDTTTVTNIPGGSNAEKVYNYLYSKLKNEGSSSDIHMHVAAAMGVMQVESPGFRAEITGGYKGRAWGICQWLGPRRAQLFQRYGRTKDLGQQLDFMWWELNNTERKAKGNWLRATNLVDACAGFNTFERAADCPRGVTIRNNSIFKRRVKAAYGFYQSNKFTGNIQTTSNNRTPGGSV